MSNEADYQCVLEAIGKLGSASSISNMLNRVFANTKDEKLRALVGEVLEVMPRKGINHRVVTLRESRGISTKKLEVYCRECLKIDIDLLPTSVI